MREPRASERTNGTKNTPATIAAAIPARAIDRPSAPSPAVH
jgi:hypothetical protein